MDAPRGLFGSSARRLKISPAAPRAGNIEDRRTGLTDAAWQRLSQRLWQRANLPGDDDVYRAGPGARPFDARAWEMANDRIDPRYRPMGMPRRDRSGITYEISDIHEGRAPRRSR